jgi:hypothetical protein
MLMPNADEQEEASQKQHITTTNLVIQNNNSTKKRKLTAPNQHSNLKYNDRITQQLNTSNLLEKPLGMQISGLMTMFLDCNKKITKIHFHGAKKVLSH